MIFGLGDSPWSTGRTRRVNAACLVLTGLLALVSTGCERGDASTASAGATDATVGVANGAVLDLAGLPVDPFAGAGIQATVLIFVSTDCPISNQYAPEIRRLCQRFAPRHVRFWLVYADQDLSPEAIREHLKLYLEGVPALRDPRHTLVQTAKVKLTPEAAVFAADQRLVYHGRIDDRFAALGKQRPEPTQRDLQETLERLLAGESVLHDTQPAFGCYIPDLR